MRHAPVLAAVTALGAAALGAVEVDEVPQAAATIATVPRSPKSRLVSNICHPFHMTGVTASSP